MTKFVKGPSGQPFTNDQTSGSDLGADALRNTLAHDSLDSPPPTVGISTPSGDLVVGISTPTDDFSAPDNSLGGDGSSSGGPGGGSPGLGEWFAVDELTIAEDNDEPTAQKGGGSPNGASGTSAGNGNIGTLLTLGTNPDGSHFFSGNRNVDATLIGSKWGSLNLTYSFPTSGTNYADATFDPQGVSNYHIVAGVNQQAAARSAFAQLAAATGLTFTEITDSDTVHANIRISQTADQDDASAFGNFPSDTSKFAGDIWFGRNNQPFYDMNFKGTWGYATMMHEIGHTMGLKHGHQDYTNSDLSQYFGTFPRVGSQSLTPDRDGQAWSLMTYSPAPFVGQPFSGDKISQPQTYMQYDLAALQYLYGANYNTNATDSVYTFSQTTGEMFINGVGQGAPNGNRIFLTIWDGGGNDTINASNYAGGVTIDLRPGEFSTVDQNQVVNNLAYQNTGVSFAPGNFAMSLLFNNDSRSLIENATGGTGNDLFVGNTANNILDGGAGSDTVVFTNTTGVNVTLNDTNTDVIVTHDGETDTLRGIENIGGTSGNDTIVGNSLNNTLTGGTGGVDNLQGGGGSDVLIGGGFTTTTSYSAPSQPDIAKPQTTNNNSLATAVNTAGTFDVDFNAEITNSTTFAHTTINAVAFGGGVEWYRIDVTAAGTQGIFDIDGAGTLDDSIVELVNSGGTLLATNDTGSGDATFPGHDDAYLTFTFTSAGTYYVRVGRFISNTVAQPMLAGQSYQLNISLTNMPGITQTVSANNTSSLVANGGEGNDLIVGTIANDTLTGGNGNDTVSYQNAFNPASNGLSTTGVTVDLNLQQGPAQNTIAAGNDILVGFENIIGSALNDTLIGDNNDNILEGGLGNDTLTGGIGNDTASYASATAGVTVSLALQGAGQSTGSAGTDTLSGFENLLGSGFADSLTGDANANILSGGAGDDTLSPGANAGGTIDLLDGGIGTDTASFAGLAGVTATLNGALDGSASIVGGTIATLRSIENLVGSSNADTLTGDGNNNVIEGGLGDDTLTGGLGIDTVRFTGSTAVTLNLATLVAQNTGWGSDTISGFENVRTGSGADNITGDGNDNTFFDGGGNDTYNGAGGIDTVDYSGATSSVTVDLNTATASRGTFGGTDTITNIENIVGAAAFANTLTGNTLGNQFTGGSAADTIVGREGADVIFGGAGNDFLLGGTSGALELTADVDTLEGGNGQDYLAGGQGNDILRGGDGDDTLVGGIGATTGGFFANDGGDDTYDGGDGTDIAIMTYDGRLGVGPSLVGVSFDLASIEGNSAITFNGVNVGSLTSIERVTFRGSTVNDNVRGSGFVDSLTGLAGDDVLDGWIGNDTISGGLGNDTLIGGDGLDMLTYANSLAGITIDLRLTTAQNTGGEDTDTISGFEYLTGSGFGDTLRGSDVFNLMIDNVVSGVAGQTDSLFGFAGNDSILVTRAAAAVATNVNMDGGDGDDFIELRSGTLNGTLATNTSGLINQTYAPLGATSNDRNLDTVTVDGGAGNDRIILTGVASATVNAGSGADIVSISMRGVTSVNNYQITLGAGADIIQLGGTSAEVMTTARTNRVTDFEVGNTGDKFEMTTYLANGVLAGSGYVAANGAFASGHMRLTQSGTDLLLQVDRDGVGAVNSFVTVFAISNGYTGGFTAFNFDGFIGNLTLTGFGTDETITGATGNDVLSGAGGNDTLNGLGGTDTLTGSTGNDNLNGGTGTDTAVYAGNIADYSIVYEYNGNGDIIGFLSVTDNNVGNGDEGTDTLSSVEAVSFANIVLNASLPVQLFNGNVLLGTFSTIQAAVNAAQDGNTIQVASGTYVEQVVVNNLDNLTIQAAPNATVTIQAPVSMAVTGTHAATHMGGASVYAVLTAIDSIGFKLSGIDINGAGSGDSVPTSGADLAGVFLRNSSGTLTSVDITGVRSSYQDALFTLDGYHNLKPLQAGTGVVVDNDSLLAFTMTGGSIADFQKNAGRFWGANLDIGGVSVTGGGAQTTGPAQNGFIVDSGSGSIHGNTLIAIGYAGATVAYSVGVYVRGAADLDVINNIITGTNGATTNAKVLGIAYYDDNAPNSGGHVTGNTISYVDTGVDVEGALNGPPIVINNNTVTNVDFTDAFSPAGVYFLAGATTQAFNVTGTGVHDYFAGGGQGDTLNGAGGNDEFLGNGGNDALNGGAGVDTADYAGNIADYTIVYEYNGNGDIIGFLSVTDNNVGNGDEGADTLNSIEAVGFANVVLNAAQPVHLFNGAVLIGTFDTIQAAINAAVNGNTISALAGTYNENLTVNKDVTIIGANDGVAGTGARGAETIINGQVNVTVSGVTIDGVEIVGSAPGSLGTTGVEVIANNFSLVNSILNGSGNTAIITGTVTGLDIGRNLIEGYSIGIYVSGNTTAGSIHNNLIQGNGPGSGTGVQEGVFLETSHVILDSNTFDGIDGASIFVNPHGPNAVDVRDIVLNTIITNSGADRPIQILASTLTTHLTGTDFNEAMYDPNQGGPGEIVASLYFDGQGGADHLFGNSLADTLLGGAGQDELYGGGGDDVMTGGADDDLLDGEGGIDTANFAANSLNYTSTLVGWLVGSTEGNDFLQRTEITINGLSQRNLLVGGTAFADIQTAFDAAIAGDFVRLATANWSGTSTYSDANLTVVAQPGAVLNTTFATLGTDGITVIAAGGADTVTTGAGNDSLFGGGGIDTLNGGGGADYLDGGSGADVMAGGSGDDAYAVDNAADAITEAAGQGYDAVYSSVSYTLTAGQEIEALSTSNFAGTSAINLTGNEFANYLVGNDGDNILNGGAGADAMVGRGGNDTYVVDNTADQVIEAAGQGYDAVYTSVSYTLVAGQEIEALSTSNFAGTTAINLTGNEIANYIVGNDGDNTLNGGAGADAMVGRGGNDTYVVDNAGDQVIEGAGQGYDVVYTTISYTLAAGQEIEALSTSNFAGTGAINLTGNEIANYIIGNDGANVLNGLGGNDILDGRGGADTFVFSTALGATNVDQILGFSSVDDTINLDHNVFAGLGLGALNANAFVVGSAALDADDRIIYNSSNGNLYFDADGVGGNAAVLFANLAGNPVLTASDFVVI